MSAEALCDRIERLEHGVANAEPVGWAALVMPWERPRWWRHPRAYVQWERRHRRIALLEADLGIISAEEFGRSLHALGIDPDPSGY